MTKTTIIKSIPDGPYHLYQDNRDVIHACEGNEVHRGVYLVWTLCELDVPANKSFKSWECPTCMDCALKLDQQKLDMLDEPENELVRDDGQFGMGA